jgi:hypothetical protein
MTEEPENRTPEEATPESETPTTPSKRRWERGGPSPNPGGRRKPIPQVEPTVIAPSVKRKPLPQAFKPGNPGRKKGSRNKATLAALAIMEGDAETISQKAVDLAKAGDLQAIRIVLDRLVAPRRDRPVNIVLPKIATSADLVAASAVIMASIADGTVTPSEAAALSATVSGVAKVIETYELSDRIARLEEQTAARGSTP